MATVKFPENHKSAQTKCHPFKTFTAQSTINMMENEPFCGSLKKCIHSHWIAVKVTRTTTECFSFSNKSSLKGKKALYRKYYARIYMYVYLPFFIIYQRHDSKKIHFLISKTKLPTILFPDLFALNALQFSAISRPA